GPGPSAVANQIHDRRDGHRSYYLTSRRERYRGIRAKGNRSRERWVDDAADQEPAPPPVIENRAERENRCGDPRQDGIPEHVQRADLGDDVRPHIGSGQALVQYLT